MQDTNDSVIRAVPSKDEAADTSPEAARDKSLASQPRDSRPPARGPGLGD